ncbi:MAG: TonB-dependent receptor [Alphaproteobacteria bacterium]|nr:TonB-dependent receptor [Alphaproteobacteria bacterium]
MRESGMRRMMASAAAAALCAPGLLVGGQAWAQDARVSEEEPIIVTAPLDRARGDIAQGVVVLDQAAILEAPIGGLGETLEGEPGIASSFFAGGASRPIIRGLGEDRIRILSNGVGVIDASSVSPDHAVAAEGLEAERIEVLRGPAALAYGGNAVGGVVNVIDGLIAEEPVENGFSGKYYAGVATGLESEAAAGGVGFANGPLVVRLEAFTRSADDYEIPGYADAHAEEEIAEGEDPAAFAFGAAPNSFADADGVSLGVSLVGARAFIGASVRRFETLYGIPEGSHEHEGEEEEEDEEEEAIFAGPRIDLEQTRVDLRAGIEGDFLIFDRAHAAFAHVDYEHQEIEPTGEPATLFTNDGWEARVEAHQREAALLGGALSGAWGISAFDKDFAAEGEEAFITPTTTDEIGGFGVQSWTIGPFSLEGGLRYDRRTLDNAVEGEREFDLMSVSASGAWRPDPRFFLGLTLARTERAPTETELFADGAHLATAAYEIGDPGLVEEIAETMELTARWRAGGFRAEASIYQAAFEDYIALVPTGDELDELPVFQFVQADATFEGGEVEIAADLFEAGGITVSGDVAYDWVAGAFDAGGDLPRVPPRTLTLGLAAEHERFGVRVELQDVDAQRDVAAFEEPTDGYQLVNAQLTFQPFDTDALSFLIDGRNLTDQEARVHTSFTKDALPRPGASVRFAVLGRF